MCQNINKLLFSAEQPSSVSYSIFIPYKIFYYSSQKLSLTDQLSINQVSNYVLLCGISHLPTASISISLYYTYIFNHVFSYFS